MADRKKVTDFILKNIGELIPEKDKFNVKRTADFLNAMSDKEFADYLEKLNTGEETLSIIVPNGDNDRLSIKRNFELADKLGIKLRERIWLTSSDGESEYLSKYAALILDLPIKRQSQMLIKKQAVASDNNTIDFLTGQPTSDSKSSKISYPEVQMLAAQGLTNTLEEFMKFRGGDLKGFNVMNTSISRTGGVSLKAIEPYSGKVKSTFTLSTYLTGMHLVNNL